MNATQVSTEMNVYVGRDLLSFIPWHKLSKFLVVVALSCPLFAFQPSTPATGAVQGSVTDGTGKKPVFGALVTVTRSGLPPFRQTVSTGGDGGFQVSGLAAGTYSVCVQVPYSSYLDPCEWATTPPQFTINGAQKVNGLGISLITGSILRVRINDPSQFLKQKTSDGRNPLLILGIWGGRGVFRPLRMAAKDPA